MSWYDSTTKNTNCHDGHGALIILHTETNTQTIYSNIIRKLTESISTAKEKVTHSTHEPPQVESTPADTTSFNTTYEPDISRHDFAEKKDEAEFRNSGVEGQETHEEDEEEDHVTKKSVKDNNLLLGSKSTLGISDMIPTINEILIDHGVKDTIKCKLL